MNLAVKTLAVSACVLALSFPVAAQSEYTCPQGGSIVSLSHSILEKRAELSRFPARRFGAQALYLLMRYADVNDETIETELKTMLDAGVPEARGLAFAWSYGRHREAMLRLLGPDAVTDALSSGSASAMRAMTREGDFEELIEGLAALDPSAFRIAAIAVIDYPDSDKARLAQLAMERDKPLLAAAFVATQLKPKAWASFVAKLDPDTTTDATQLWSWLPATVGNPELPRTPEQGPRFDPEASAKVHGVMIAGMLQPQNDFLMTLINQTGKIDEAVAAAAALRQGIADGSIARDGTLDASWLLIYRTLLEQWSDPAQLQGQLDSFDLPTGRRGPGRTLGVLDRIIAIDALTPFLRGETAEPPGAPNILSAAFRDEWSRWLAIADKVKTDPTDPSLYGDDVIAVAAEMLLATGQDNWFATSIPPLPPTPALLQVATDIAVRLDRMCESYLAHPTEALTTPGQPIFKFDGWSGEQGG